MYTTLDVYMPPASPAAFLGSSMHLNFEITHLVWSLRVNKVDESIMLIWPFTIYKSLPKQGEKMLGDMYQMIKRQVTMQVVWDLSITHRVGNDVFLGTNTKLIYRVPINAPSCCCACLCPCYSLCYKHPSQHYHTPRPNSHLPTKTPARHSVSLSLSSCYHLW